MKKSKKKREPKKSFSGDRKDPITMVSYDDGDVHVYFNFTNVALKMMKQGKPFQKAFLRDGKRFNINFMHDDVYNHHFRDGVQFKTQLMLEQARQKAQAAEAEKALESDS